MATRTSRCVDVNASSARSFLMIASMRNSDAEPFRSMPVLWARVSSPSQRIATVMKLLIEHDSLFTETAMDSVSCDLHREGRADGDDQQRTKSSSARLIRRRQFTYPIQMTFVMCYKHEHRNLTKRAISLQRRKLLYG